MCEYDDYSRRYACVCNIGYQGKFRKKDRTNDILVYSLTTLLHSFLGDGRVCEGDRQPCNIDRDVCDYNADCMFDVGSYTYACRCNEGYTGDGYICEPEDGQRMYSGYPFLLYLS